MDLDAILRASGRNSSQWMRLAHTNAPGSRQIPKLLHGSGVELAWRRHRSFFTTGCSIFSTVKGLSDVVAKIAAAVIRGARTDSIPCDPGPAPTMSRSSDLTPKDLIQRSSCGRRQGLRRRISLNAPRYWLPAGVTSALLRELRACVCTAERVDEQDGQLHARPRDSRVPGRRASVVLVCVHERPNGEARWCARRGAQPICMRAPWTAIHVGNIALSALQRSGSRSCRGLCLRLAERLGGEAITVPASGRGGRRYRIRPEPITFTHVVIARPHGKLGNGPTLFGQSIMQRLVRRARRHQHPRHGRGERMESLSGADGAKEGNDPHDRSEMAISLKANIWATVAMIVVAFGGGGYC